jgi:dihydrofolate reductase
MRKIIAAINMTIDGFCDHTAGIPDEELHKHYTELLRQAGAIIYGRITYKLMEGYWPAIVKQLTGNKPIDDFAIAIGDIPKIVFSNTLNEDQVSSVWKNARLAKRSPENEVQDIRQQKGKDILVGSPGMIAALTRFGLIDEYQLCIHPVIAGGGLRLFPGISGVQLKLVKTKTFGSGAIILYYENIHPTSL